MRERGRVPGKPRAHEGDRNGRNAEAWGGDGTRARGGKEWVYCMGSMIPLGGPGERVRYKYATRVEANGVVLCQVAK